MQLLQAEIAAIDAENCGERAGEEAEGGGLEDEGDEGVQGAKLSQEDMAELMAELAGLETEEEGNAAAAHGDEDTEGRTAALH